MAKRGNKKQALGPIAAFERAGIVAAQESYLQVITPEQRAKGGYEGDGRRIINRGGTPVMRWITSGRLTDTQALAINTCYRLWEMVGIKQRTTAAYGERIAAADWIDEQRALTLIEAQQDLDRIKDYIPAAWWSVFENVCRFDEPAGVAGSKLGFGERTGDARAHTVVCMVADIIAMRERLTPVVRLRVA